MIHISLLNINPVKTLFGPNLAFLLYALTIASRPEIADQVSSITRAGQTGSNTKLQQLDTFTSQELCIFGSEIIDLSKS